MSKHNGYANYETWNVALWIQSDEGLYSLAVEHMEANEEYGPDPSGAYEAFAANLREQLDSKETPDGVAWNDSGLDHEELDEVMHGLVEWVSPILDETVYVVRTQFIGCLPESSGMYADLETAQEAFLEACEENEYGDETLAEIRAALEEDSDLEEARADHPTKPLYTILEAESVSTFDMEPEDLEETLEEYVQRYNDTAP